MIIFKIIFILFAAQLILGYLSKYTKLKFKDFGYFCLGWGESQDVSLSIVHIVNDKKTHCVFIDALGGKLWFNVNKKSNITEPYTEIYGLHSVAGELIWNSFFWYNKKTKENHIYKSPWTTEIVDAKYLNINLGELTENKVPVKTMSNTTYNTKTGNQQTIDQINFYVIRTIWSSKLIRLLHLQWLLNTTKLSLLYNVENGQTLGDSASEGFISINQITKDIIKKFIDEPNEENKYTLIGDLDFRLAIFMMMDKNF